MTKKYSTKKALIASVLSLVLCFSMLVGTTFAWFTDSVTSANNIITSGNLDVELYYQVEGQSDWTKVTENTNVFKADTLWEPGHTEVVKLKVVNAGSLALKYQLGVNVASEVGSVNVNDEAFKLSDFIKFGIVDGAQTYTRDQAIAAVDATATALKTAYNSGTTALDAKNDGNTDEKIVTMVVYMPTSVGNDANAKKGAATPTINLGINVVATQNTYEEDSFGPDYDTDAKEPEIGSALIPENSTDATTIKSTAPDADVTVTVPAGAPAGNYTLEVDNKNVTTDTAGNTTVAYDIELLKDGATAPDGTYTVAIEVGTGLNITGVTHKDVAITDYNYDIATGIITFTTNSFSPFTVTYYDGNVSADATIEDVTALIAKGANITLQADLELAETLTIPEGTKVVLDLNGKIITGNMHKNVGAVIKNEGNLVLKNGTVKSAANNGGSALVNGGVAVLENVTLNGAPNADGSWPSYTMNNTGVVDATNVKFTSFHGAVSSYGEGALVTLNNCEIDMQGIPGFTSHGIYTYNNGAVVVNGGTYVNHAKDQSSSGASVINGAVTVNAGTFNGRIENYYGTPVIKGGTFSANPTRFVKGYEVTDNGNGTWTVDEYKVSTEEELVDAIANGKAVELTQDVILGKINLTDAITKDVVIDANGHKITTTDAYGIEVTAGKNVTISNAVVEMTRAGDYITYAAGFKIANGDYAGATITLENCKITMANTDWAYAVTMPASVKNLNLVINNCTLEGAIAVQCWGDNNTITITNSKLICNYTTNAQYTSYCVVLQNDGYNSADNNTLVIDNCEFLYSGIDNFNSLIAGVKALGTGNTVTVTNCTYGEKVVEY